MSALDDTKLMAFADGTLPESEAEIVAAEIDKSPELSARLDQLMQTTHVLRAAFDGPMQESPPQKLLDAIDRAMPAPATIIDLASARAARAEKSAAPVSRPLAWRSVAAMAAALFVGIVVGRQWISPVPGAEDPLQASTEFAAALERAPSLAVSRLPGGQSVTAKFSFARADGTYCRQFSLHGAANAASGIACREQSGWRIDALVPSETGSSGTEYQAAGGDLDPALETVMTRMGARDPLDAKAERQQIRDGWKKK